jgi:menaquinol-cytochrome c reductase iron-sulfur subunit
VASHGGDERPHEPSPTIWPVGFAVGIACMLAGIVVSTAAVIVGAAIALVFGALWARDAMRPTQPDQAATVLAEPELEPEEVNRFPRNQFLELTTLGIAGVITAVVALPVVGFAILPAFTNQKRQGVDLGPTDNFPENEWIEATFLLDPSVGEVSRRTAFVRYNGVFENLPSYTLISNRCVHLGCPVQAAGPRREDERKTVDTEQAEIALTPVLPAAYSCPCHGGAYDTEGNRTAGPPVRAMDRFKFDIDNGRLILLDTFSVAKVEGEGAQAKLEAYGVQGPGEHVDGLEGWLYPLQPQDLR